MVLEKAQCVWGGTILLLYFWLITVEKRKSIFSIVISVLKNQRVSHKYMRLSQWNLSVFTNINNISLHTKGACKFYAPCEDGILE